MTPGTDDAADILFSCCQQSCEKPAATRILVCLLSAVSSTPDNTLQLALHLCVSMLTLNTRPSWGWWKHHCIRILILNQINKATWYWSSISQTVALCSISEPDEIVCCTESSGNVQKNCLEERTHFQKVPGRWLDEPSVNQPISMRALHRRDEIKPWVSQPREKWEQPSVTYRNSSCV